jgi:uncharacterized repeat protein (TIGR01451 family)
MWWCNHLGAALRADPMLPSRPDLSTLRPRSALMLRRKITGFAAVAVALCIGLGAPIIARAGLLFRANITKTHAGNFTIGQNGTFTIAVSMSSGANGADRFSVTDTLPAGLTFVSATGAVWTCTNAGAVVTCGGASALSAGSVASFSVIVQAGQAASPSVVNTATLHDASSANVSATTIASDTVSVLAASTTSSTSTSPTTTTTSSSTSSSASAISAPPSGSGSLVSVWAVLLLGSGLAALITTATLRRRRL